jgi:hypothetical protein
MLDNLKMLLGIAADDTDLDDKLRFILACTVARLKLLLGGIDPPDEMNHILIDVSIMRFNRIGSEGLSSHSIEGESLSFNDSDFDGFMPEIQAWLDSHKESTRGKVRFL